MDKPLKVRIKRCYQVEVFTGENVSDYYDSEYCFTTYQDAKELAIRMKENARAMITSVKEWRNYLRGMC